MNFAKIPISQVIPNEWNPNEMNPAQVKALAESLDEFGNILPIVVRLKGDRYEIIDGEHRFFALQHQRVSEIEVVIVDADDIDARRLTQILNRTKGEDDPEKLLKLIQYFSDNLSPDEIIKGQPFESPEDYADFVEELEGKIESSGSTSGCGGGLTDDDEAPDDEAIETRVKRGDVWRLGQHWVMCGDSTSIDDVKKLISDRQIDMVYTDPPYGINESGDRRDRGKFAGGDYPGQKYVDFIDDSIEYAIKAYENAHSLKIPIQVWWGANYYCHHLPQSANWVVWDKRCDNENTNWNSDGELAWVKSPTNSVRIFRHLWQGYFKASEISEKRVHPTQKPVALAEWCFERYGSKSRIILDFFLGSGSTLIACEKTDRICYGMELSEHYCDVILRRWEDYTGQVAEKVS